MVIVDRCSCDVMAVLRRYNDELLKRILLSLYFYVSVYLVAGRGWQLDSELSFVLRGQFLFWGCIACKKDDVVRYIHPVIEYNRKISLGSGGCTLVVSVPQRAVSDCRVL